MGLTIFKFKTILYPLNDCRRTSGSDMKRKHILSLIFLSSFFTYSVASDSLPVHHLGLEQGLSNNGVTSIYQDYNGFMWFGTYDGLNRFDGYNFKTFRNIINDSTSLNDNHVGIIEGDNYRRLWIGCEKGLSIYNPVNTKFSTPVFKSWNESKIKKLTDDVRALKNLPDKEIVLVGTQHQGLLIFEKENKCGVQIPLLTLKGRETNYGITAIAYNAADKKVWVFITDIGLCQYDIEKKILRIVNSSVKKGNYLKVDTGSNLWFGSDDGLFRYTSVTNSYSQNLLPASYKVVNLFEDKQKTLWIGTDGHGMWLMPANSFKPVAYRYSNGASIVNSNVVYSIYEDAAGSKWIGTLRGGINVIQPGVNHFRTIKYALPGQNSLVDNFVLSFHEDNNNNLWIGTDGAGLRFWNRKNGTFTNFIQSASKTSISSNFITDILRDSQGDLWVTTWFGGINRLKKGSQSFERFTIQNLRKRVTENNTWIVYEDMQKRLWVSTTNDGSLYLYNRSLNSFEIFDDALINIQAMAEDGEGKLWAGNYSSLTKIDFDNKRHQVFRLGYTVRSIYEDRNKNFWIGTDGGGLLLFDKRTGKYQRYTTSEGLPSNTILQMLEDNNHNLWLSTYNGLCKFHTISKTCRNYTQSDGLQSNQFSFNAALALKTGEFAFGGIKGFNIFYPDSIYEQKQIPKTFLTGLRINNTGIEEDDSYVTERDVEKIKKITLPYNEAILSIDFVALEYNGADKIEYSYKLQGWDKGWNNVNTTRTANYSRLEEGTYAFTLKVTNASGIWGGETKLLTITVLPPWYRTWLAYVLYVLAAASLIYFYIKYKTRQTKLKYEVKLAHLEAEKEKELNEKKLSFFTDVSHEFRTPLTLIINPLKDHLNNPEHTQDKKDLNIVYRNARRLLSLVDQLLLFQKAETERDALTITKINFYNLCKDVFSNFVLGAKNKKIDYRFVADNESLELYGDKEKMEIILYNLLSNALKYTPESGQIIFNLTEEHNNVQVAVSDSGTGIPDEIGNHLFERFYQVQHSKNQSRPGFGIGLYLVKHFTEKHKGNVSFQSEPGKGTTFYLTFQKGTTHLKGEIIYDAMPQHPALSAELTDNDDDVTVQPIKTDLEELIGTQKIMLVIEDEVAIRKYVSSIFMEWFVIYEAGSGEEGLQMAKQHLPDIIISDVMMQNGTGLELCNRIKGDSTLSHIPVVLLTAVTSADIKLKGVECGADDYITKPFEKELLVARVNALLKNRTALQQYFYNEVTLQKNDLKISAEYKEFLERCIAIVESHLEDDDFNVKKLAKEIGMSHSNLYRKVKTVSGQSVTAFIRFLRLRKSAELMLKSNMNVNEAAFQVGINDVKYFRKQFQKLFNMNPSDYIKKYRQGFSEQFSIHQKIIR